MVRARFFLGLLVVLTWLSASASPAQAQTSAVSLRVQAGFDGYYKDGMWIPVRILLANDGSDARGTIKISAPRYNGSNAEFVRPVELPAGARKEVFMYVAVEGYVSKIVVSYADGGSVLAMTQAKVVQLSSSDLLYGVLAASPSAFGMLSDVDPINGQGRLAQIAVEDLPPASPAWKSLDLLVVSDVDTGQLSAEQRSALGAWIAGGGRLIVAGGPNWQKTAAGLADLLPLTPTGTQTFPSLRALGAYAQDSVPEGAALVTTGPLHAGAVALISDGATPLVVERAYGYGRVDFLAFDPSLAPVKGWRGMAGIYRSLLSVTSERPSWSGAYRNWYNAGEAVNAIPGIGLPHPLQVCVFLGGYVFVVGPLNYLILRRLKRRELAWITIPAAVVLFGGITYAAGLGLRGTRATLHRLTVAQVWEDADLAQVEALIGIFSPRRAEYDLQVDGDVLLRPLPSDTYYRTTSISLDGMEIEHGGTARVRHVRVDVGAITPFVAQGRIAAPRFRSTLIYAVSGAGATLTGSIANASDVTLHDAVLLSAGGSQRVGLVEPGRDVQANISLTANRAAWAYQSTAQVLPPLASGSPPSITGGNYSGYDQTIPDILGTASYYDNRQTYRRYSMLSWLFDPYSAGGRGNGTYLVGWADSSPVTASLAGGNFNTQDETMYIVRFEPEVVVTGGVITVPPGLMTWEVLDPGLGGGGSPYDTYLSQGYFALRFRPSVRLEYTEVQSLTLHLKSYGSTGSAPVAISLWDHGLGGWVELDRPAWGDTLVPVPGRFVSSDGRIDVMVDNSGLRSSVSIEAMDFTLVLQR